MPKKPKLNECWSGIIDLLPYKPGDLVEIFQGVGPQRYKTKIESITIGSNGAIVYRVSNGVLLREDQLEHYEPPAPVVVKTTKVKRPTKKNKRSR